MPAPTTVADFLQIVRKSCLVQEKTLQAFLEQLPETAPSGSGDDGTQVGKVASAMVCHGLLSFFQAEKLLEGKWRGFTVDKYKVLERLGKGGLGNVYLCEHQFTHQPMAVKVLRGANSDDPIAVKRFYREAQAAASLVHPNIARAYDVGQDNKLHFLVMDYVDGINLQELVQAQGPMNLLRAAHYIRQAAEGLHYAHEAGFVHRDIKPSNLLLDRQGTLKILDMGLARISQEEEADVLTRGGEVLGSADYLAPEQALDSHNVDLRADIYALGATFYFLLTGKPPFSEAKTIAQKLVFKQSRRPLAIQESRPQAPAALVHVVERMMATEAGQRYATAADVAAALTPFTKTPIPPPPEAEMPRTSPAVQEATDRPHRTRDSAPGTLPKPQPALLRRGSATPTPFPPPGSVPGDGVRPVAGRAASTPFPPPGSVPGDGVRRPAAVAGTPRHTEPGVRPKPTIPVDVPTPTKNLPPPVVLAEAPRPRARSAPEIPARAAARTPAAETPPAPPRARTATSQSWAAFLILVAVGATIAALMSWLALGLHLPGGR